MFALYAIIARSRARRSAITGLVLSVGGALFVAAFAALAVDIWRHARVA